MTVALQIICFGTGALIVIGGSLELRTHRRRVSEERDAFNRRFAEAEQRIAEGRAEIRAGVRPHGSRFTLHRPVAAPEKETHVFLRAEQDRNDG